MLHQKPQNLARLLSIGKTWHTFWVLSKPGKTETWHAFRAIGKSWQKKTHPFLLLAKHVKTKIKPSGYWQNLVRLPNMGKTKTTPSHFWENKAEPKLGMRSGC
jgi:hypothetical protein